MDYVEGNGAQAYHNTAEDAQRRYIEQAHVLATQDGQTSTSSTISEPQSENDNAEGPPDQH